MKIKLKNILLVAVLIFVFIFTVRYTKNLKSIDEDGLKVGGKLGAIAPEIKPGGEWINSKPLTIKELQGKVVLIDFWTYSCYNCLNTIPYMKSWDEKYSDKGLVIIGVHSPEFEIEKKFDNVRSSVEELGIKYPVVQDNNFDTWNAYSNRYWPSKYLIDKKGTIRYHRIGEGAYKETEEWIVKLLNEN